MFAQLILLSLAIYLGVGILFALVFVTRLVGRVDPEAGHGPIGFRLLIFPGAALLWPMLFRKVLGAREGSP